MFRPPRSSLKSGSGVDPDYTEALEDGKLVHFNDPSAKYSCAGRFKFWIDGYTRESYYDLEARAGPSLSAAKLTKKYLNAQMLHWDEIEPGRKNPLTKAECYHLIVKRMSSGGVIELAPKVFEIFQRLEKDHEEKFGKEPEPPQIFFSGKELTEMIKKGDWPEAWGGPDELKRQRAEETIEEEKEKQTLEDMNGNRKEV